MPGLHVLKLGGFDSVEAGQSPGQRYAGSLGRHVPDPRGQNPPHLLEIPRRIGVRCVSRRHIASRVRGWY